MRSTGTKTELERLRKENRRLRSLLAAREQTQEASIATERSVVTPTRVGNREELDQQATALAIIANEMVSNAMKHGKGDIELTLRALGSLATLEVCDDGPGSAAGFSPELSAHTGLELIENIARYDLRGETVYENRQEGGARITVVFPTQHPVSQ